MMYPTVIAALSDQIPPVWRASGIGVYRFQRDMGYAVGALLSSLIADFYGRIPAFYVVAIICLISGVIVFMKLPTRLEYLKGQF